MSAPSPKHDPDDRSPLAKGWAWVSRITAVSLAMALPGLGGYFLDQHWNLTPWLTVAGGLLGFALGMVQLLAMFPPDRPSTNRSSKPTDDSP